MLAPEAHIGYYMAETLVPRLKEDVVEPAAAQGYERIWLVGISMGGLGALMYERVHPEDVTGVFVICPFLGYRKIIREVADAGGVRNWSPGPYEPETDWQRMFWDWIRTYSGDPQAWPPIFLGYGRSDDFVQAQGLLAEVLPRGRVFEMDGGHDLPTMRQLWDLFLDAGTLDPPPATADGKDPGQVPGLFQE
jgi:pimeloyl-ACP methyl ester carboxylesterase